METIYSKHRKQLGRLNKNISKSIILDAKKYCNKEIKRANRTGDLLKVEFYTKIKNELIKK